MEESVIREVEDDPREGVAVTIEEGCDSVQVPPPCAGCLGTATKSLPSAGINWIEFPYCDACVPPRADEAKRREGEDAWRRWSGRLLGPLAALIVRDVGGRRGNAVKMLLGPSGTVRLGFKNRDYARLFVEANGARMPED